MKVADFCSRAVVTVRRTDEVVVAAEAMRTAHIGFLVVVDEGSSDGEVRPVGVLTDRDIVLSIVATGTDPRTVTVGDVMSENPLVINDTDSLDTAVHKMRHFGVRRLPIVGHRGELAGVLSMDDVLNALAGELQNLASAIRSERRVERAVRP